MPGHPGHREHRAHRATGALTDIEVHRRRGRGLDLPHDLGQVGRRALRGEQAGRDHLVLAGADCAHRVAQVTPVFAVRAAVGLAGVVVVLIVLVVTAVLEFPAGRVAHAAGHDQHVTRMLGQQFVGLEHQRLAGRVPQDLVDANLLSETARTLGAAQVHQVDRVAGDGGDVDVARERHRDARLGREAVQGVDDADVVAVAHPHRTVGLGQVDSPVGVVRPVAHREAVAGERPGRGVGGVEADGDAVGQHGQRQQRERHGRHERAGSGCKHVLSPGSIKQGVGHFGGGGLPSLPHRVYRPRGANAPAPPRVSPDGGGTVPVASGTEFARPVKGRAGKPQWRAGAPAATLPVRRPTP